MKAKHHFAPGVLEGPYYKRRLLTPERVEAIGRAVLFIACLAALAATLGFTVGYFNLGGFLP
jgi:hypothetical protein